jgi:hypothetical protein
MNVIGFKGIGTKRGLIKIKGNLISIVKIIVEAGVSVGGADKIKLNEENENAANKIPGIRINKFIPFHNSKKIIPNIKGTVENIQPKRKELHTLPRRIVLMEIGQVIKRSKVFCLVSHGKTTGPMDVEVRKRTMVISPEIIYNGTITLPIVKAKNNIIGKRIPCMTTGPLL